MVLNNDHSLQQQIKAGVGMDHNSFRDSSSQMWKCKVPDGARGGMGSPLGCLQNRPLVNTTAGTWYLIVRELFPRSPLALHET